MKLVLQICAGILLAFVAVAIAIDRYVEHQANVAIEALNAHIQRENARSHEQAIQREIQSQEHEAQRHAAQHAATAKRREAARIEIEQTLSAAENNRQREQAWITFFKPSPDCNRPKDWDARVTCANAYMRAQQDFDQKWNSRSLSSRTATSSASSPR